MLIVHKYLDPGSGFIFSQAVPAYLWGFLLAVLGGLGYYFKFFFRFFRRFFYIGIIFLAVILIGAIIMQKKTSQKVVIIGIDAMDPGIVDKLMSEGKLPNLSRLRNEGAYAPLRTTIPAESVVAWTSFASGLSAAGHGVFDFIMRDPQTYMPYLTLNEIDNTRPTIGIHKRNHGEFFWQTLSRAGVRCSVYFCPNTFPPEKVFGNMLSGMGTPDILGTMGRFSFYTTKELSEVDAESRGRIFAVVLRDGLITAEMYGPRIQSNKGSVESVIPFTVKLKSRAVNIHLQGASFNLQEGGWSAWQKVSFKVSAFKQVRGIVKFYLKSAGEDVELYATPINFDPSEPPFPVSYPDGYARELCGKIGLYHTQGMPHDTWALTEDRMGEKAFLEEADDILSERTRILLRELKRFKSGMFFFYFDTLDMVQHMFWRYSDSQSVLYESNAPYAETIANYYEKLDGIIGQVVSGIDRDTTLIILSDHGFAPFRKVVHLNRWLQEQGYLVLKPGVVDSKELFESVDWGRTKAYSLGFGGIYLNKVGREGSGIVRDYEAASIEREIISGLQGLTDPLTNDRAVSKIYTRAEAFSGPYADASPDLFVGFHKGYRVSWQTVLGAVPKDIFEVNKRKWSGDHLIDPALVPGVFFVNKKVALSDPSITDIAATVLNLFSVSALPPSEGKILFEK